MHSYLRLLVLAAIVLAGSSPTSLHAQRVVDLRARPVPSPTHVDQSRCTVVGDGLKGRPEGLLGVTGAVRTRDGTLVIANTGTSEVLAFDSTGAFLRSTLRGGEGPAEISKSMLGDMESIRLSPYRGDSVALYDSRRFRISVLDQRGAFARSVQIAETARFGRTTLVVGSDPAGDFMIIARRGLAPRQASAAGSRVVAFVDSVLVFRLSANGSVVWASPPLEGAKHEIAVTVRTTARSGGRHNTMTSMPNPAKGADRLVSVAVARGVLYQYVERLNEVRAYDRGGNLVLRVFLPLMQPVRPTANAAAFASPQALFMLGDAVGRLWLEVPQAQPDSAREWWVLNADGELARAVRTPPRSLPLSIGSREMVLRSVDRDGVEAVQVCTFDE